MVEALGFATLFELRVHVGARIRWIFNPSSSRLPPQSGQPCSKGSEECSALQVLALQQAIPGLEPDSAYDGALPSIDAAPGLHRRHALQVLMRPRLVVPTDELDQRGGERLLIRHDPAVELLLERAEEPFDAPVLPGAVLFDGLVANAELMKHAVEQGVVEDGFVVGADGLWHAVSFDGVEQCAQERDGGFVRQRREVQAAASTVVEDAEQEMSLTGLVGLAGAVHAHTRLGLPGR